MYERHCIFIWPHHARVAAARHTRLTRSTGPTSVRVQSTDTNARDPLRACPLAACSSCAARKSAHEDMRMPPQLHHFDKRDGVTHLEARARQTPIAGWHAEQCRRQTKPHWRLLSFMLQHCSSLYPPVPTRAHLSSLRARDGYRRSTGSKVACGRAVASERQVGLSFWPRPRSSGRLQLSHR